MTPLARSLVKCAVTSRMTLLLSFSPWAKPVNSNIALTVCPVDGFRAGRVMIGVLV